MNPWHRFFRFIRRTLVVLLAATAIHLVATIAQTLGYLHVHGAWIDAGGPWRIPISVTAIIVGTIALWIVKDELK